MHREHPSRIVNEYGSVQVAVAPRAPGTLVIAGPGVCYTRQVDGTTAYLLVWSPSDLNGPGPTEPQAPADLYGVEITAAHDCEAWC